MKLLNKLILNSFTLLVGIAIGWIIKGAHLEIIFTAYLPALATLMAAYFGASYAFDLQSAKEKENVKQRNIVNGNLTIFYMSKMLNNLLNYQSQIIEPVRGKNSSFLEMRPTLPSVKDNISLNIDKLSFLLSADDPNILGELSIEESRYQRAMEAIKERSKIHILDAQTRLESAGIVEGGNYSPKDIEEALGKRLFITLQQSTNQVIEHVDATIISLRDAVNKLSQILKKLYPGEKINSISTPTVENS